MTVCVCDMLGYAVQKNIDTAEDENKIILQNFNSELISCDPTSEVMLISWLIFSFLSLIRTKNFSLLI